MIEKNIQLFNNFLLSVMNHKHLSQMTNTTEKIYFTHLKPRRVNQKNIVPRNLAMDRIYRKSGI